MQFKFMDKKYNIGIIGLGYVGQAIFNTFSINHNVFTYDIQKKCTEKGLESVFTKSDIIFLCLPTPMKKDGSCSIDIISSVLNDLNNFKNKKDIVIKSTIPPGTCDFLQEEYDFLNIIFNPEFLTEANFTDDFLKQNRIILGGNNVSQVKNLYENDFPDTEIIHLPYKESEMVKYFSNVFLATKVSFANELFSLCKAMNIDYNTVLSAVIKDDRIGKSHFEVPGPDGKYGFGGSCFPKDLSALISVFEDNNIESIILNSVWDRNITIDRKEKDWENLKGRAIEE